MPTIVVLGTLWKIIPVAKHDGLLLGLLCYKVISAVEDKKEGGVPILVQWKQIQLESMRTQV